jgi:hypothetical protein
MHVPSGPRCLGSLRAHTYVCSYEYYIQLAAQLHMLTCWYTCSVVRDHVLVICFFFWIKGCVLVVLPVSCLPMQHASLQHWSEKKEKIRSKFAWPEKYGSAFKIWTLSGVIFNFNRPTVPHATPLNGWIELKTRPELCVDYTSNMLPLDLNCRIVISRLEIELESNFVSLDLINMRVPPL